MCPFVPLTTSDVSPIAITVFLPLCRTYLLIFSFCSAEDETQGLLHARPAPDHRPRLQTHTPNSKPGSHIAQAALKLAV